MMGILPMSAVLDIDALPMKLTIAASNDAMTRDYERIAHALRYLEENVYQQPSLADVAEHVGLSPYHFQRLFKRWAGISPKRFLQFLTVEYAKGRLAESSSVLDAAFDAGLSGPSRLHDLFVACEAMTPGEYKQRGQGLNISYGFHDSPFGECLLLVTPRGLCGLAFADHGHRDAPLDDMQRRWPRANYIADSEVTLPIMTAIASHLGWSQAPSSDDGIKLLLMGTNFQVRVWEGLLRIPLGHLTSYDRLSGLIGRSGAARAVAGAVAANPISLLVPCHRVIRNTGIISGYHWGPARKRAILAWEAGHVAPAT